MLNFETTEKDRNIQTGISNDLTALTPETWNNSSTVVLSDLGEIKVFAKNENENTIFSAIYDVKTTYPGVVGAEFTGAIYKDDEKIKSWATTCHSITYGEEVDEEWQTPELAVGAAQGTSTDIVCLGRGGEIVMEFSSGIKNEEGDDFAIFENSFSNYFLELAYVEVSSDGENFVRFDNAYLGEETIAGAGAHDTKLIGQLAGKYEQGYGTPFDLETLKNKPEIIEGVVDLSNINFVKIIDIVGDGSSKDSFNHIIYDPYPTTGSAGFDLDAIGVMNQITQSINPAENTVSGATLLQNYPNPFNPVTTISYQLRNSNYVNITVFNAAGKKIWETGNKRQEAGKYMIEFDGSEFNSGIYFYTLEVGGKMIKKRKMMMIK